MIGSYISHFEMLQILPRNAKREYYAAKFLNNKTNPKHAWKTVNEILEEVRNKILLMKLNYQRKQSHQLESWLMCLTIILPMLVLNLLKKLNTKTAVALEILFLNMNQLRDSLSNL